jgi:hypothetical protein
MAYLSSDATLDQVRSAYRASASYDLENDLTKCREYIQALRFLIELVKDETRQGSAALRDQAGKFEKELDAATSWLAARDADFAGDGGGGVTYLDLSGARG